MGSTTVRDLVKGIHRELLQEDVAPVRARQMLIELTALSGNCSTELREAEAEYNAVLLRFLDSSEASNRAKIRAATTPEYARYREAKDTFALVVQLIRSIKAVMRNTEEEMRLQR